MDITERKNIAVVGCGYWGSNLVRNFYELGFLAAICDPDKEVSKKFSNDYSVRDLSYEEILIDESIDGVALAVPAPLHASLAIEAMKCNKHVFVEKPLAMTQNEGEEMIKASINNNVKLMVGHLLQYHPVFMHIRKSVNAGELGKLNYISSVRKSFGKVRSEEDVIWSFAPHDISMILSLTGHQPSSIRTETSCILQNKIADIATIHMDFNSNLKSHISVSWIHPYKEQKLIVSGDSGMLVFDDTLSWNQKLAFYDHKINLNNDSIELNKANVKYLEVEKSEPLKNECMHFINVVNKNIDPLTDAHEGLRVLNVLNTATI